MASKAKESIKQKHISNVSVWVCMSKDIKLYPFGLDGVAIIVNENGWTGCTLEKNDDKIRIGPDVKRRQKQNRNRKRCF